MDKIYCSKCGKELKYTHEHFGLNAEYIIEPCPKCAHKFIHVKDRLPKEYDIVIVRWRLEPFFGSGYVCSDGNWCTSYPELDNQVISWADIPPIGRKYD
jgi:DNA-directed RNA polymerase subunit RPC12/RpoP